MERPSTTARRMRLKRHIQSEWGIQKEHTGHENKPPKWLASARKNITEGFDNVMPFITDTNKASVFDSTIFKGATGTSSNVTCMRVRALTQDTGVWCVGVVCVRREPFTFEFSARLSWLPFKAPSDEGMSVSGITVHVSNGPKYGHRSDVHNAPSVSPIFLAKVCVDSRD